MHLQTLHLHNFRLYKDAKFEFSPQINIIRGSNGRGKTSLLEAIYFLMTGRSFRTSQASDLVRHGTSGFCLEASFVKHEIQQKLRVAYQGGERRVTYNSTPCSSSLSLLGLLQGVVFHPDDAAIVKGAPSVRRHLLDLQLAQSDPLYVHHLTRYERAMRQRNYLLRAKNPLTIESWEYEMANAAAYIIQQRAQVVEDLQEKGKILYSQLGGADERFSLAYKAHGAGDTSTADTAVLRQLFFEQFRRHRAKEMELGMTLTGPHKDDLTILLENKEVRTFASEGQQRSCVVALRLAEWERLHAKSMEKPLMLIDDPGIGLDDTRRAHLRHYFSILDQVFLTTTEDRLWLANEHVIAI